MSNLKLTTSGTLGHSIDQANLPAGNKIQNIDLEALADEIRSATGFKLDLNQVKIEIVDGQELYRQCAEDLANRLGISKQELEIRVTNDTGNIEFDTISKEIIEQGFLALYLSSADKILIGRNLFKSLGGALIKDVLKHELIHAAQYQTFPKYFESIDKAYRYDIEARLLFGKTSLEYLDARDTSRARAALIEGQASFFSVPKPPRFAIFDRFLSPLQQKYALGFRIYEKMARSNSELVNFLFKNPEFVDILFKTRGAVKIEIDGSISDEARRDLEKKILILKKLNPRSAKIKVILCTIEENTCPSSTLQT